VTGKAAENLNYDSATGEAEQSLTLAPGVACSNCWASANMGFGGQVLYCLYADRICYPADWCVDYANGLCESQSKWAILNATALLTGDLEVNMQLTAGKVLPSRAKANDFTWTHAEGPVINLGDFVGVPLTVQPAFDLQSDTATSASLDGLNGTISWSSHFGTPGAVIGFNVYAEVVSNSAGVPKLGDTSFSPILSFTPQLKLQTPSFSGLARQASVTNISLVPDATITLGLLDTSLPVDFKPAIYAQLATGTPGMPNPATGTARCANAWDSYYQANYGGSVDVATQPLTCKILTYTFTLLAATTLADIPLVDPTPFPGSAWQGCVSQTWGSGSGGGGGGAGGGGISGATGAEIAVIVLALIGAAVGGYVFRARIESCIANRCSKRKPDVEYATSSGSAAGGSTVPFTVLASSGGAATVVANPLSAAAGAAAAAADAAPTGGVREWASPAPGRGSTTNIQ
jgi:hypothetical protein